MKYLGMYSGRLYDNKKDMEECGIQLSDEKANDEEYIDNLRKHNKIECMYCRSCPLSRR